MTKRRLVLLLAAILSLSALTYGCIPRKITDKEQELLVTLQDVKTVYKLPSFDSAQCEKFTAQTVLTGAKKLEYEFSSQKNPANQPNIVIIKCLIDILPTASRADSVFEQSIKGYKIGLSLSNKEANLLEDPKLFTWGDENYSSYLTMRDKKLGNFIMTRKGNVIYTLILVGFYIDDKESLLKLLRPKVEKVIRYYGSSNNSSAIS